MSSKKKGAAFPAKHQPQPGWGHGGALKRWGPPRRQGLCSHPPTCGPLLILSPALNRWGVCESIVRRASVQDEVDIPAAGTMLGNSVILPKEVTENPSKEELEEYAKWMGMDLIEHQHLLWIAKEALCAPLPPNWRACQDEKGGGAPCRVCDRGGGVCRRDVLARLTTTEGEGTPLGPRFQSGKG